MSVIDNIQKLFKTKSDQFGQGEARTSSASMGSSAVLSMNAPGQKFAGTGSDDSFSPSSMAMPEDSMLVSTELLSLPVLGVRPLAEHQKILVAVFGLAVASLALATFFALSKSDRVAQQVAATGQALMQSQRLAKSVSQALVGSAQAFPDVRESADVLSKTVRGMKSGDEGLRLAAVSDALQLGVTKVAPLVERAEQNATVVMGQKPILLQVGEALRTINRQSSDLLEVAETVSSLKLQQNAAATEISASGQLVMLTQRIGKSANEFLTMEGVSPEAVFLLGKDLNTFKEIAQGLLEGSPELRLGASKDPQTRERLEVLIALYEKTRVQAGAILGNLQGLVSAREAQASIIADSEPLRRDLEELQAMLSTQTGLGIGALVTLIAAALVALFGNQCRVHWRICELPTYRGRTCFSRQRLARSHSQKTIVRLGPSSQLRNQAARPLAAKARLSGLQVPRPTKRTCGCSRGAAAQCHAMRSHSSGTSGQCAINWPPLRYIEDAWRCVTHIKLSARGLRRTIRYCARCCAHCNSATPRTRRSC